MSVRDLMVSVLFDADISDVQKVNDEMDNTTDKFDDIDDKQGGFFQTLGDNWKQITVLAGSAGAGLEAFARKQGDTNETLDQTAISTGLASDELRDMAVNMSDNTLSAKENADAFELLVQKGIDTKEGLEQVTPAANDLATATGQDLTNAISDADLLLSPFGDSLEDLGENTDQITRLMQETDVPIGSFSRNIERVTDELQGLDFGLDDAAAGVEVFRDRGKKGKESVREFRRAVDESGGDMDAFLDSIGLTADEWKRYQDEVDPATDLTKEMAEAAEENTTPMEKLQNSVENLMVDYGAFAELAGMLAPALIAIGPAIGLFTKLAPLLKLIPPLLGAISWPITAIVAGIVAIGAGFVLAYNKVEWFRDGVNAVWDWIKEATAATWDWVSDKIMIVWDFIVEMIDYAWERILELWDEHGEFIMELAETIFGFIQENITDRMEKIQSIFEVVWPIISTVIEVAWELIKTIVESGIDLVVGIIDVAMNLLQGDWEGAWESIKDTADTIWQNIVSFFEDIDLYQIGSDILQGLIDGISSMAENVWNKVEDIADGIMDKFSGVLEIFSPSRVFEGFGKNTMEGFNVGYEDESDKTIRHVSDTGDGISDAFGVDAPRSGRGSKTENSYSFTINVEGGGDSKSTAKEVKKAIESILKEKEVRAV